MNLRVLTSVGAGAQRFGDLVQKLFKAQGMTQFEFAEKTGYSQSYISRVESGERPFSEKLCQAFATALNIDPVQLKLAYEDILKGNAKTLDDHFDALTGAVKPSDGPGVLIRQLQRDDILDVFAAEAEGEFSYNGEVQDCEIEHFNPDFVRLTSYDTVVGAYVEYDNRGNEKLTKVKESVTIEAGQSLLVIVKEHIMLPSCIEAEIHPASNIGQKHLIVAHGPVIDPGWSGYLRVSVFNPTSVDKIIRTDEPFLTLRFWMAVPD